MKKAILTLAVLCGIGLIAGCDYQPRTSTTDSVYMEIPEIPKYEPTSLERFAEDFLSNNQLENDNSALRDERDRKFQKEFKDELKKNPHLLDSTKFEFECFGETRNGQYPIRLQSKYGVVKGIVVLLLDRDMAVKINEKTTKNVRFKGRYIKMLSNEAYDYYLPYKTLYLSEIGTGINKDGQACFSPLLIKADTIWFE
jgi:hypothetical protein